MKTYLRSAALASAAILILLGGSTAAFASTYQPLNLAVPTGDGGVTYLGTQTYNVAGGDAVYAMVDGQTLTNARIQYSFTATQSASGTTGYGTISLTGYAGHSKVTVSGSYTFNGDQALGTIGGIDLPGFFVSYAPNINIKMAGSTEPLGQPFAIESPYANPFGGPIVLTSADGVSLVIVATYNFGTINWQGTQLAAYLGGTLGGTQVTGVMTLTGNEFENLVTGTAIDQGIISFSQMSDSSLDANGTYQGTDYIPSAGAVDCSAAPPSGLTGIPGTCYETGFQSKGTFRAGDISGSYSTTWGIPALTFGSTIQATVSQGGSRQFGNPGNGFSRFLNFWSFLNRF